MEKFPGAVADVKKSETPKGFYEFDQKIIEEGRADSRYETDKTFRMAIDFKALHNEVIRMAPIEGDYMNDNPILILIARIKEFEKNNNIELNGVTVHLRDMLDSKNEKNRKESYVKMVGHLSGMDSAMDIVLGKIKE